MMRKLVLMIVGWLPLFCIGQNAEAFYDVGNGLFQNQKYHKAGNYYTQALAIKEKPRYYYARAMVLLKMNREEEALADLNSCLLLKEVGEAYYHRAGILLNRGMNSAALADYSKAKEMLPHFVETNYFLGYLYYLEQEYELALKYFNEYDVKKDKDHKYYYYKGLAESKLHMKDTAMKNIKKAAKMKVKYMENIQ
ncbi:MAG: hypothetical protein HKN92_02365 [Chitinophagales bacterium]|nr:hypothetical protein [Chitinophagales bacterium]